MDSPTIPRCSATIPAVPSYLLPALLVPTVLVETVLALALCVAGLLGYARRDIPTT